MPGPPPTPTALKLLRGNPGKKKLNDAEPTPPRGTAKPPEYILARPELLKEWDRQSPRLAAMGVLTVVDEDALATLCVMEVLFREMLNEDVSPLKLAKVSAEKRALWARFGMTPADRTRVKAEKTETPGKLGRFLSGQKA